MNTGTEVSRVPVVLYRLTLFTAEEFQLQSVAVVGMMKQVRAPSMGACTLYERTWHDRLNPHKARWINIK